MIHVYPEFFEGHKAIQAHNIFYEHVCLLATYFFHALICEE